MSSTIIKSFRRLDMPQLVSYAKRTGFIFPSAEIYNGMAGAFDYGPYGARLKRNIEHRWVRDFVDRNPENTLIDTAIVMPTRVWEASGHFDQFVDPVSTCRSCSTRTRADKAVAAHIEMLDKVLLDSPENDALRATLADSPVDARSANPSIETLDYCIKRLNVRCPHCDKRPAEATEKKKAVGLGPVKTFNLLFHTRVGALSSDDDPDSHAVLRPETAQGVYINARNLITNGGRRLPIGIAQVGKSFRNEIAPTNFIFRTREFEQMELQYFVQPDAADAAYKKWISFAHDWVLGLGVQPDHVKQLEYEKKDLAHYALATTDLIFKYPFGWEELWGIALRGDYDLKAHEKKSGVGLYYSDPYTHQKYHPFVIEPAVGLNRLLLAIMTDCVVEETISHGEKESVRTVFRLKDDLAPIKAAILPVVSTEPLDTFSQKIQNELNPHMTTEIDFTGSIGKRYRRQDEIGTPLCITVDEQSLSDSTVTVRGRDSMRQVRLHVNEIVEKAKLGELKQELLF